MSYQLKPLNGNVSVIELKPKEVKEVTAKTLIDTGSTKYEVLQYGRVVGVSQKEVGLVDVAPGDIILYQKLASHKTNFGDPRIVLVPIEKIEAGLEATND